MIKSGKSSLEDTFNHYPIFDFAIVLYIRYLAKAAIKQFEELLNYYYMGDEEEIV